MKKEYTWEIRVKNTPALKRKCNRCSGDRFYCSDKFRMNSQKRNTDIWLIYRCVECDSTYNLTLLSRTKTELIKKELFSKFSGNDKCLAWEYAFSAETAKKNRVELDYGSVEYEILHDPVSIEAIASNDNDLPEVAFRIRTPFGFGLKLTSVIRFCFGLSANRLNRLIEANAIFTSPHGTIKKQKVNDGDVVFIHKERLKNA